MVSLRHIGIVLFEQVEELDAAGPWEVLAFWTQSAPEDGYAVTTLSPDGGMVTGAKGLRLGAHFSFASAPSLDVLVYPGGWGTRADLQNEERLAWVRDVRSRASLMTSVCTGALVYAAAGLLRGQPATTHWGALDHLRIIDQSIDVRPEARVVDDGDMVTCAGVSAGIDMALHLVARLAGTERAVEVRRGIQYELGPLV